MLSCAPAQQSSQSRARPSARARNFSGPCSSRTNRRHPMLWRCTKNGRGRQGEGRGGERTFPDSQTERLISCGARLGQTLPRKLAPALAQPWSELGITMTTSDQGNADRRDVSRLHFCLSDVCTETWKIGIMELIPNLRPSVGFQLLNARHALHSQLELTQFTRSMNDLASFPKLRRCTLPMDVRIFGSPSPIGGSEISCARGWSSAFPAVSAPRSPEHRPFH